MRDIKALQLESRFSLPPNSLGYCGKDTAPERFKKCIREGDCDGVEEEVSKFIVLNPYLKTLATISSLSAFSYPVIDGYWMGSDLLRKARDEHYDLLLDNFLEQGVPDFFVEELRQRRPKTFIPSHFFHVIYVGVGQASGAVPFNLNSINSCMIRWGKVEEVKSETREVRVGLNSLRKNGKKYELYVKEECILINAELVSGVSEGDMVAVHWNMVVKKLTEDEVKRLEYWTRRVLDLLDS